jgi:putative exosortase-associated protein (TIGR04073 family)
MKKLTGVFFVTVIAAFFASVAFAADTRSASSNDGTVRQAGPMDKAERGFTNAAFGWTEIPKKIVDKTRETRNPFTGLVLGSWQGSCKAFARTASGASELVTFPIGRYDKPRVLPDMPAAEK